MDIRKILVPTDFSACADYAGDEAIDLAGCLGAEVTLLHVYRFPAETYIFPIGTYGERGALPPASAPVEGVVRYAEDALAKMKRRLERADVPVSTRVEEGPPVETIVHVADEGHFDIVVMGTRGRTAVERLFAGSTAEHVVRKATTPVLTIHPAGRESHSHEARH